MHIYTSDPHDMPSDGADAKFLTPADLTKDQMSVIRGMAKVELTLAWIERTGQRMLSTKSWTETTVNLLIKKALASMPAKFMAPAVKELDKPLNREMMRHALTREAAAMLARPKVRSQVIDRSLRPASTQKRTDIPRNEAGVEFLTTADLTEAQKSFIWVVAELELRAAAERMGKTLAIAESRKLVDLLIEMALGHLPAAFIKELDNGEREKDREKREFMRRVLNREAVSILGGESSSSAVTRAIRRPSAPRGDDVFRLNLTLSHELDAAIDDVGYRARATGGARLAKTEVIRAACRLLLELNVDLDGVKNEDELLKRLRAAAGLGGEGKK